MLASGDRALGWRLRERDTHRRRVCVRSEDRELLDDLAGKVVVTDARLRATRQDKQVSARDIGHPEGDAETWRECMSEYWSYGMWRCYVGCGTSSRSVYSRRRPSLEREKKMANDHALTCGEV